MRVTYYPKSYRPVKEIENEALHLFSLLHVLEPVEKLTLVLVKADGMITDTGLLCWACFVPSDNTIYLPTKFHKGTGIPKKDWPAFVLWNLCHEYVHAIRERDGRDTGHRGFENEMKGLYNRLLRET